MCVCHILDAGKCMFIINFMSENRKYAFVIDEMPGTGKCTFIIDGKCTFITDWMSGTNRWDAGN